MDSKIEQYLFDLMLKYKQPDSNIWLLDDQEHGLQGLVIMYAEPLVVFRAEIMNVPGQNVLELYTKLLELNATDIIHGAYAIENGKVILIDTIAYDTMEYAQFSSMLHSFGLALSRHCPILLKYSDNTKTGAA